MTDRFQALRLFARVARTGSFSAPARELGLSQPSASRIVAELERELSAALVIRTTRAVKLTEAGTDYLARGRADPGRTRGGRPCGSRWQRVAWAAAHWHVIELRRARGDPAPAGISRTAPVFAYQPAGERCPAGPRHRRGRSRLPSRYADESHDHRSQAWPGIPVGCSFAGLFAYGSIARKPERSCGPML
jgi:Bacterial regulatory helix-turn-helix protein, lysR family